MQDLSYVDFSYACLRNVFFSRANLQCAKFRDVDAEASIFHNATLRECEFTGANLRGALLAGANLQSANLQDACLIDCSFCGADLRSAHLQTADLTNSNLEGANLEGANLKGAKLTNANLKGANLQRAYLRHVNLRYDPEDLSLDLQSSVDILVATPGRLMDHINNTKGFTLEHLCYLVVDETDRLLREAYQSWLPTVLQLTHSSDECLFPHDNTFLSSAFGSLRTIRRFGIERGFKGKSHPRLVKMVLSATLTQDPSKLAQLELHHPLFLTTGQRRYQLPEQLQSFKLLYESNQKPLYLVALLLTLQGEKSIVFTSSVESTHRLCTLLKFFGDLQIKIKEYSGLQRQSVRSKILKAFRSGEIQVLVSSDAMTRGMDVEGVRNVINYDMPAYIKTFVHRAGRTARAGQTGRCFTLLRKDEVKRFEKLLRKADNNSCPVHSVPSDSIEPLRPVYTSALKKLKECVESETRKRKISVKSSSMVRGKKLNNLKE